MLGTKRILAAKKVNSSSIFCGVIDGIVDKSEVAAIALCYTSLEDMLNDEDKILAINYLYKNELTYYAFNKNKIYVLMAMI